MNPGDIISYTDMCSTEGYSLQRGMNFRVRNGVTVILMSVRKGAPYADQVEGNGQVLIYEGHDVPKNESKYPKEVDQKLTSSTGKLTQNGKFFEAVREYENGGPAELVKVYEKIKDGIWVYNGIFELINAWFEKSQIANRNVAKYKLLVTDRDFQHDATVDFKLLDLDHNRMIPTSVKLAVWRRDQGKCTQCGSNDNLHFDHILPFSKGGTSLLPENIQLLCARHNLSKSNNIL